MIAQIELWTHAERYSLNVTMLPKHLDEKVARLHLKKLGVELTTLTDEQSEYLHVSKQGPFKSDWYRY